mgnify:CR=1 FL=1
MTEFEVRIIYIEFMVLRNARNDYQRMLLGVDLRWKDSILKYEKYIRTRKNGGDS